MSPKYWQVDCTEQQGSAVINDENKGTVRGKAMSTGVGVGVGALIGAKIGIVGLGTAISGVFPVATIGGYLGYKAYKSLKGSAFAQGVKEGYAEHTAKVAAQAKINFHKPISK